MTPFEKWLNNQRDQCIEIPGIFRKNWQGCEIPEKQTSFFDEIQEKVVGWTAETVTVWTESWPIQSFHPIICWKSHFLLAHKNRFFQTGKKLCVWNEIWVKTGIINLQTNTVINQYLFTFIDYFQSDFFIIYLQPLTFSMYDTEEVHLLVWRSSLVLIK